MTTQGPLGNKQLRVEDWVTLTPVGNTGTSAINTVTVNASAGAVPAGAYFSLRSPDAPRQEAEGKQILGYHVWYNKDSAVDPLPRESNQPGIQVVMASGQATDVVASNTVSAINAYFTGTVPAVSFSAERSGGDVVISNKGVGPSRVTDGIGSRNSVAASTGFTFASTTPGINVSSVSFTIASTIEASGATGASIQQLVAQITDTIIASTYNVANDAETFDVTMPADATGWPASAAAAAHWQLFLPGSTSASTDFYVWYSVAGAATDPSASGTGIEVAGVASADLAASLATKTASSINTDGSFTATASADVVTVQAATTGTAIDAVDVNASVSIVVNQQGGGDFTVDFSNRIANPDFDSSSN